MVQFVTLASILFLLSAVTTLAQHDITSNERCETLKTSLTYTQENAPQDISGVVSFNSHYIFVIPNFN